MSNWWADTTHEIQKSKLGGGKLMHQSIPAVSTPFPRGISRAFAHVQIPGVGLTLP